MMSKESWDCVSCRANQLCEKRNCNGITNPNFLTVLQISDKVWEPVNVCPINLLPSDYAEKATYAAIAKHYKGISPAEVDDMDLDLVKYLLASITAETFQRKFEQKQMEVAMNKSKGKFGRKHT